MSRNKTRMVRIPDVVPPLPREHSYNRNIPIGAGFSWLAAGWRDFTVKPHLSLAYGIMVFAASMAFVWSLFLLEFDYVLFPALAGFMVVGPLVAVGLYEKSRRIATGEPLSLARMIFVNARAGGQVLFTGVMLCLLMLLWMRAAVLLYALIFGLQPFPGLEHIGPALISTTTGWLLLIIGTLVGGLFAAFSLAISAFSFPMLLNEKTDAFTAMGTSMALVWNNLPAMLVWGAIVVALFGLCLLTGLLGLIIIFPLLGHASWHAYVATQLEPAARSTE